MKKITLLFAFVFSISLLIAQNNSGAIVNHPQTPISPFTYNTDSVEYDNADKTVHLGATLSYPKGNGPFITAVLITGSGLQDRDENLFGHKPFAVIADYLTKKGFAILRVDDRTKGKSKGDLKNATSADFADDVLTSINYLLQRKEIDKNKIGLIGHSEGGLIAPIVYTKWPKLAFIITLAGTGVSGAEILFSQQTDPVKSMVNTVTFDAYKVLVKNTLTEIHDHSSQPDSLTLNNIKKIFTDWKANEPDSILIPLNAKAATPELYAMQIKAELQPWLKYFIATEPSQFLEKVKCPFLALNGSKDIQVNPEQNITAIKNALEKAGNKNVTTKIFPGLNHLFQHCIKCTVNEYKDLEETFAPEALEEMGNWLQQNIKK